MIVFKDIRMFKNFFQHQLRTLYGKSVAESSDIERYVALGNLVREELASQWALTRKKIADGQQKRMHYFSFEFLLGRMLENNLRNLGVYDTVVQGLADFDVALGDLVELERDPGLGNGGLGRLAACFMDSLATQNYAGNGNTIRYKYGLFKQLIVNHEQVEAPDQWMQLGNCWEVRRSDMAVDVAFGGHIAVGMDANNKMTFRNADAQIVRAVAYDMPLAGAATDTTNVLRMWSAEPSEQLPGDIPIRKYLSDIEDLCLNVYPDDSGEDGKMLRIKQEYFFVAAGLEQIVREHLALYGNLDNFHEKNVIQLNDTHPALAIPELMRILMDNQGYEWQQAWEITSRTFAYTNHTVMFEALEKWPLEYIHRLLPRIYMIIEEIDRQYGQLLQQRGFDEEFFARTRVLGHYHVRMANLSVIGSFSVNGVAKLHTDILIHDVFKDFYALYPERFNNKTNGITPRRWFLYNNPELRQLVEEKTGARLDKDFNEIAKLAAYADDSALQQAFLQVKQKRKDDFAAFLSKEYNIHVDSHSVFDVIAKRLHAYKRQLLDIFYVIYLYQRFHSETNFRIPKTTFFFAAKAAAGYRYAKEIIKLINCVAEVIAADPLVSRYIQVVFIPNYRVTVSEKLVTAADISEQISMAGKEASGTGNMKFMMNGALTLGTLDGANVEIAQLVGDENIVIFGHTTEELHELRNRYRALEYYQNDLRIRKIIDALRDGTFSQKEDDFKEIANEFLVRNDEYFLLADFSAYVDAHQKAYEYYGNPSRWAQICLHNIAKSAYFSSDRTIRDYVREIWKLESLKDE